MKRPAMALLLAISFSCVHTTHVDRDSPEGKKGAGSGGDAAQPKEHEGGAAEQPHLARKPQKPGRPPLAAAPGGLFVPGGVERVQRALEDKGYLDANEAEAGTIDGATSAAVRKFQTDEGIARTGNPDHETVRRLGLNPDELFRKSAAVKKGK